MHAVADSEAKPDMREHEPTRDDGKVYVGDRRQSPWLNPQFIVQILVIIVGVYVASQVRTAGLESAAANLNEKAARMETQVSAIATSVQTITTQSAEMRATMNSQMVQINDLKQAMQMQEARIIVLEKGLAKAEARSDLR